MSLPVVIAIALVLVVAALVAKKVLTPEAEEPRSPPSGVPSRGLSQAGDFASHEQQQLFAWLVTEASRHTGSHLEQDVLAMQRLREAAAKALEELEAKGRTEVNLPFLTADSKGPKHFSTKLTRDNWRG